MPVPPLAEWRERWTNKDAQRLGVRPDNVADGFARFWVDFPWGDERDEDEDFLNHALAYAVDIAALAAVISHLDPEREQPNGTAALHLNFLEPPSGPIAVEARVVHWHVPAALVELVATDTEGRQIARGLSPYSLRARTAERPPV